MTAIMTTAAPPLAPGQPRIIGGPAAVTLADHHARYGPLPLAGRRLIQEVEAAGLRGRGGAGFPTHLKLAAVQRAAGRRRVPVVVANGTEGEPASAKDAVLLRHAPHLVIDGVVAVAALLGAPRAVVCVDRADPDAIASLGRALAERGRRDPLAVEVAATPSRYVTGEETALVSWLSGRGARPTSSPPRPADRGVDGAPTLVDNVETLADLALVARYGAAAYRQVGDPSEPGTLLATVTGGVERPAVYEAVIGSALAALLRRAGAGRATGILVGGYSGTWLRPGDAYDADLSTAGLARFGATPGCGVVAVLPAGHCPLQEVASVVRWLAANSAGQCGACVHGMPALASAFDDEVAGDRTGRAGAALDRWAPMLVGRGACKLPDGAVRFVDSARRAFADHIEQHRQTGPCPPNRAALLPTPRPGGWR